MAASYDFPPELTKRALHVNARFIIDVLDTPEAEAAIRQSMQEDCFPIRLIGPMLVEANDGKPLDNSMRIVAGALLCHVVENRLRLGTPDRLVRQYGKNSKHFVNWRRYRPIDEAQSGSDSVEPVHPRRDGSDLFVQLARALPTHLLENVRSAISAEIRIRRHAVIPSSNQREGASHG